MGYLVTVVSYFGHNRQLYIWQTVLKPVAGLFMIRPLQIMHVIGVEAMVALLQYLGISDNYRNYRSL